MGGLGMILVDTNEHGCNATIERLGSKAGMRVFCPYPTKLFSGLVVGRYTNEGNRANQRDVTQSCSIKTFRASGAKEFFDTEGAVGLLTWFESIESVLHITKSPAESQVEFASSMLPTLDDFKKLLKEEYCPDDEVQKLESEFLNHKMVGSDIDGYTARFHELARLVPHMVTPKSQRVNRYIRGLAPEIKAHVTSSKPVIIQGAVSMTNRLTIDGIKDGIFKKNENAGNKKSKDNGNINMLVNIRSVQNANSIILEELSKDESSHYLRRKSSKLVLAIEGNTNQGNNRNASSSKAFALGCRLELKGHTFIIDLIPFGHGSFDVIIGMDWLSKLRAKIVCFKKIVQILLSNEDILEVHGERPEGNLKQLKTMKVDGQKLEDILVVSHRFPGVFLEDLTGLPLSREVEFRIDLIPGAMPVAKLPYRLAPTEIKELSNQLKELKDKGFIRPSSSPWGAPVIDDLFDQLQGSQYFSKIDLRSGYHQLRVREEDIPKPIPDKVQRELEFTKNLILELLEKEKLFGKFLKYEFWLQEVHFLRHVVNSKGIHVDPSKIESVKNWKPSKTSTKIYSFLGLAGYYKRFITNFSKIAKPLTLLTQKNKKFEWGDEQEIAFLKLKDILCDVPILELPEGADDFVVYCDTSNQGFGCVLMQRNKARILEAQSEASKGVNTPAKMLKGLDRQFERKEDGGLYLTERIWVPVYCNLRTLIMNEAHAIRCSIHPGANKMYYDLQGLYWWPGMKKDIAMYVSKCLTCSKGQSHNTKPLRLLQQARDSSSRMENIHNGLLITSYQETRSGHDIDLALFDRTDQISHFLSRPFEVVERVGPVAYRLRLPQELVGIHDTFHVSNLKKCLADVNLHVPLEEIRIDDKLRFVEEPIEIMDREVKKLKRSWIPIVKVRWNSRRGPEFTWEREDEMKRKYPQLFASATA
ncbi:putative reverse transcriptase domain-containing protein [Tanacetum coccineum]